MRRRVARIAGHLQASKVASRHSKSGRSGKGAAENLAHELQRLSDSAAEADSRIDALEAKVAVLGSEGGEPAEAEPPVAAEEEPAAEVVEEEEEEPAAPVGVLKVVVLGGTGHVGSYLCPRLGEDPRYHCVCVSRSTTSEPYAADGGSWENVERVALDRSGADHNSPVLSEAASDAAAAAEAAFVEAVAALNADVVIDMICFTQESCERLVEGLKGTNCGHFLHVGSIWSHGHSLAVPTLEGLPSDRAPLEEYGEEKNKCEQYLLHSDQAAESKQHPRTQPGTHRLPIRSISEAQRIARVSLFCSPVRLHGPTRGPHRWARVGAFEPAGSLQPVSICELGAWRAFAAAELWTRDRPSHPRCVTDHPEPSAHHLGSTQSFALKKPAVTCCCCCPGCLVLVLF